MVNEEIRRNAEAEVHHMGMQDALDFGAMALFGEKYGDRVRVLRMGDFSTELCGGTHVHRTGDIGLFKILSEGGVAAGIRRIEAVTGRGALAEVAAQEALLEQAAGLVGGRSADLLDKLRGLLDRQRKLEREIEAFKAKAAAGASADLASQAVDVSGIKVVAARLEGFDAKGLREAVDVLKQKLGDVVVILAAASDGKASLIAGSHGAALSKVKAGDLLSHVAQQVGGKGGGRPDMAQGGGNDGDALVRALSEVPTWVAARVSG
ncbi:MAG: DHHA1 domain-containing protein, partial [Lysobacteraceae bacterium]